MGCIHRLLAYWRGLQVHIKQQTQYCANVPCDCALQTAVPSRLPRSETMWGFNGAPKMRKSNAHADSQAFYWQLRGLADNLAQPCTTCVKTWGQRPGHRRPMTSLSLKPIRWNMAMRTFDLPCGWLRMVADGCGWFVAFCYLWLNSFTCCCVLMFRIPAVAVDGSMCLLGFVKLAVNHRAGLDGCEGGRGCCLKENAVLQVGFDVGGCSVKAMLTWKSHVSLLQHGKPGRSRWRC